MEVDQAGGDRAVLRERWSAALKSSVKCDLWGQVVEALDGYESLSKEIIGAAAGLQLGRRDQELLHGLVLILKSRCELLSGDAEKPNSVALVNSDCMKVTRSSLDSLFSELEGGHEKFNNVADSRQEVDKAKTNPFPVDVSQLPGYSTKFWADAIDKVLEQSCKSGGVLIPRPLGQSGDRYLSFELVDLGVKNAELFEKPFIRVTVLDKRGKSLEPKQETPVAEKQIRYRCDFNTMVHIQTSVATLVEKDAAIFFEFVHYKPAKQKYSTRCWSLLETDEFIDCTSETKYLEVYEKPVSKTRRKFRLLSNKKLYLTLKVVCK